MVEEARSRPEGEREAEISSEPATPLATATLNDLESKESETGAQSADGEVVLARPLYRDNPPPAYPALARRRQWQGTVVLEVLVQEDGLVAELSVDQGSGHSVLDQAALAAVRNWRFTPGRRGRLPVAMKVLVPVRFGLE